MAQWTDEEMKLIESAMKYCDKLLGYEGAGGDCIRLGDCENYESIDDLTNEIIGNANKIYHTNNLIDGKYHTEYGPNGLEINYYYDKATDLYDWFHEIPEKNYQHLDYEWTKKIALKRIYKDYVDIFNGRLNNSNKRKNITWEAVNEATNKVQQSIMETPDNYTGIGFTLIFSEIADILGVSESTLYRWLTKDKKKKQNDIFKLFSDKASRIIKNDL